MNFIFCFGLLRETSVSVRTGKGQRLGNGSKYYACRCEGFRLPDTLDSPHSEKNETLDW